MATEPIEPRLETTALDQSTEASTAALYRAAIGPVGEAHYLPPFLRFEEKDRAGVQWNSVAALTTLNWFVFRQLWLPALAYVGSVIGLTLLVFGIGRLVFQFSEVTEMAALGLLTTLAFVLPGLFGTALFYKECHKRVAAALAANATVSEACAALTKQASTRQRMVWIVAGNAALLGLIVAIYLLAPTPGKLLDEMHATAVASGKLAPRQAASAGLAASAPTPAVSTPELPSAMPAPASSSPVSAPVAAASAAPASAPAAASSRAVAGVVQTDTQRNETPAKPASATSAPASAAAKAVVKPSLAPSSAPASAPVAPKPAIKLPPKPAATAPVQPATPSLAAGYYINVGLFAEETNAKKAHTKLLDAGLTAFVQEIKTPKGKRMRVRVGPLDTEAQAESAATKIRSLQLEAVVFQQ